MNNAIVCLTRGYATKEKYQTLIDRNCAIRKYINPDKHYPLVIFHEGNITTEHQEHIIYYSEGQEIRFVDIRAIWLGGYEAMCEFHILHIWHYCKEYDNIMRIDEDCIVSRCDIDPFKQIQQIIKVNHGSTVYTDGNIELSVPRSVVFPVFLRSTNWAESHTETNATLPDKIEQLTGVSAKDFYNDQFPYTNVCVANVKYFLSEPMLPLLTEIATCEDQRKYRWGDLPVLGSLLNIYAKDRSPFMKGFSYLHGSHEALIDTDKR